MNAPSNLIVGIMVHEFEALMFVDAMITTRRILTESGPARLASKVAEINGILKKAGTPEAIDDGQHTAPSKRLAIVFGDRGYNKVLHGPAIAHAVARIVGAEIE